MLEVLRREGIYLWFYFSVQLEQNGVEVLANAEDPVQVTMSLAE